MTDRYDRLRLSGLLRSAIIGYGIAAFCLLAPASELTAGYRPLFLIGIGVQVGALIARKLVRALPPYILELFADGVTVLFFALGTVGSVYRHLAEII